MDENGNFVKVKKTRMVKKAKNDIFGNMIKTNEKNGSPLDHAADSLNLDEEDPDEKDAEDITYEIAPDGTKIKVIRLKDGTIIRKKVNETPLMKKLKEQKRLKNDDNQINEEKAKLEMAKREIQKEKEKLNNLQNEKEKLMVKEKFSPPGIKGKIKVKRIDENGNEYWEEVDPEDFDFDDNASVYEEVIDEFGNKVMVKVSKDKINAIKK